MRDFRAEAEREVNRLTPVLYDEPDVERDARREHRRRETFRLLQFSLEALIVGCLAGALFEMFW